MVEAQERDAMDKGMRTLWVVWAAMVSSLLIYVFICLQLGEGLIGAERTEVPIDLLKKILFGLAVAELIMAYYLRMVMLKGRSSATGLHGVRGPATLTQPPFVGHYSAAVIVSLAFSESIGIYGFVLYILGGGFKTLYIFIAVSALAMVFYRPKREEMEKLAIAYKKQTVSSVEMNSNGMR